LPGIIIMDSANQISMETVEKPQPVQEQAPAPPLTSINIPDENTALNVMVSFLHLAQKRGAFNIQESAKLWECVKLFMKE
jgi:hypothetical protein